MKNIKLIVPFFLILITSTMYCQGVYSTVPAIMQKVQLDSMLATVRVLTGQTAVQINDSLVTFKSRHADQPGNEYAAWYLKQKLESYNLSVQIQDFNTRGKNVIGRKLGLREPGKKYIICAHYDDMVAKLVKSKMVAGRHQIRWNFGCQASGLYMCKLCAGDYSAVRKLVLIK